MKRSALVAGATGLVGQQLLQRLLEDPAYDEIRALVRRPLPLQHPRLQTIVSDFTGLAALGDSLAVQDVFCCLGTTLRTAGSRAAFEDVDYRMVVELAQLTKAAGAHQFVVISAVGAAAHALSFYSRVKGRMEQAIAKLGFDAVHIVRPSLLLGTRSDKRPAEDWAQNLAPRVNWAFVGPLARYRPVAADDVAQAMLRLALRGQHGVNIHHLPLQD
jgi:uncharacterized protein YbjT (DUF2867 family)